MKKFEDLKTEEDFKETFINGEDIIYNNLTIRIIEHNLHTEIGVMYSEYILNNKFRIKFLTRRSLGDEPKWRMIT